MNKVLPARGSLRKASCGAVESHSCISAEKYVLACHTSLALKWLYFEVNYKSRGSLQAMLYVRLWTERKVQKSRHQGKSFILLLSLSARLTFCGFGPNKCKRTVSSCFNPNPVRGLCYIPQHRSQVISYSLMTHHLYHQILRNLCFYVSEQINK